MKAARRKRVSEETTTAEQGEVKGEVSAMSDGDVQNHGEETRVGKPELGAYLVLEDRPEADDDGAAARAKVGYGGVGVCWRSNIVAADLDLPVAGLVGGAEKSRGARPGLGHTQHGTVAPKKTISASSK